eukprot:g18351.t1
MRQPVRPSERLAVRAARAEKKLRRKGITKYNKRFRAWSQKRNRKYKIALPVVITSDPELMDANELWKKLTTRVMELSDGLDPVDWGYVMWSVGKAGYLNKEFLDAVMMVEEGGRTSRPALPPMMPHMGSFQLMAVMWGCKRIHYRDVALSLEVVRTCLSKLDDMRPADFAKILHACASLDVFAAEPIKPGGRLGGSWGDRRAGGSWLRSLFGLGGGERDQAPQPPDSTPAGDPTGTRSFYSGSNSNTSYHSGASTSSSSLVSSYFDANSSASLKKRLLEAAKVKLDQCTAQEFRDVCNPLLVGALFDEELIAYEAAVTCRVLFPHVWERLEHQVRQFYVKLSMRHIPCYVKSPDGFHWNVSKHLSQLELTHRNLDGEVEKPTTFFLGIFFVEVFW